jgi:hypothetical protein
MRFNTEVLESMGWTVEVDGPWINIHPSHGQNLHLEQVCEQMYDAGLSEGIVESVCNDIQDMVHSQVILAAMQKSALPVEMKRKSRKA